jgi:hypothetical protein
MTKLKRNWSSIEVNKNQIEYCNYLNITFRAACVSGFFSAFFSLPFDNAKTKMQKMKDFTGVESEYKNIFQAIRKVTVVGFISLDCSKRRNNRTILWLRDILFQNSAICYANITDLGLYNR